MLRKIYLYDELAEKYGSEFEFDFDYPAQAIGFLTSQLDNFKADLLKHKNIRFAKTRNGKATAINQERITMHLGKADAVHLIPVPQGSGFETGAAIASYIIGSTVATYSIAAIVTTILLNIALSFVMSAVVQALSPSPKTNGTTGKDSNESILFNGQVNVFEQGWPVSTLFGRFRGSAVNVSAGMEAFDLPIIPVNPPPPAPFGGAGWGYSGTYESGEGSANSAPGDGPGEGGGIGGSGNSAGDAGNGDGGTGGGDGSGSGGSSGTA